MPEQSPEEKQEMNREAHAEQIKAYSDARELANQHGFEYDYAFYQADKGEITSEEQTELMEELDGRIDNKEQSKLSQKLSLELDKLGLSGKDVDAWLEGLTDKEKEQYTYTFAERLAHDLKDIKSDSSASDSAMEEARKKYRDYGVPDEIIAKIDELVEYGRGTTVH